MQISTLSDEEIARQQKLNKQLEETVRHLAPHSEAITESFKDLHRKALIAIAAMTKNYQMELMERFNGQMEQLTRQAILPNIAQNIAAAMETIVRQQRPLFSPTQPWRWLPPLFWRPKDDCLKPRPAGY